MYVFLPFPIVAFMESGKLPNSPHHIAYKSEEKIAIYGITGKQLWSSILTFISPFYFFLSSVPANSFGRAYAKIRIIRFELKKKVRKKEQDSLSNFALYFYSNMFALISLWWWKKWAQQKRNVCQWRIIIGTIFIMLAFEPITVAG